MSSSPARVFAINTVNSRGDTAAEAQEDRFSIIRHKDFESVLKKEHLSKEKVIQGVRELLQRSWSLRASLFQGLFVCLHTVLGA